MNVKRIAALATLGAMISTVAPALAVTAPVTVKWNTQKSAAITIHTQTTASLTHTAPVATDEYMNGSPAMGAAAGCNGVFTGVAGAAGKDGDTNGANADGTVNFGNVTPDGVDFTNCMEINAAEAFVTTNDGAGVNVQVSIAGTPVGYNTGANGSLLCIFGDGYATGATPAGATAYAASARAAAIAGGSTTACPAGGLAVTAALAPLVNSSALGTQDLNQDFQLNLGPNSTVGSVTATLTYTVTPN